MLSLLSPISEAWEMGSPIRPRAVAAGFIIRVLRTGTACHRAENIS